MSLNDPQKSSYSGEAAPYIHIAATEDGSINIRESDHPEVVVTTTPAKLKAFILGVKNGEFDHLAE